MKNISFFKKLMPFIYLYIFMLLSMIAGFFVKYYQNHVSYLIDNLEAIKLYFGYDFALPFPPVSFFNTIIIYILLLITKKIYLSQKINKIVKIVVVGFFIYVIVYFYIFSLTIVYELT